MNHLEFVAQKELTDKQANKVWQLSKSAVKLLKQPNTVPMAAYNKSLRDFAAKQAKEFAKNIVRRRKAAQAIGVTKAAYAQGGLFDSLFGPRQKQYFFDKVQAATIFGDSFKGSGSNIFSDEFGQDVDRFKKGVEYEKWRNKINRLMYEDDPSWARNRLIGAGIGAGIGAVGGGALGGYLSNNNPWASAGGVLLGGMGGGALGHYIGKHAYGNPYLPYIDKTASPNGFPFLSVARNAALGAGLGALVSPGVAHAMSLTGIDAFENPSRDVYTRAMFRGALMGGVLGGMHGYQGRDIPMNRFADAAKTAGLTRSYLDKLAAEDAIAPAYVQRARKRVEPYTRIGGAGLGGLMGASLGSMIGMSTGGMFNHADRAKAGAILGGLGGAGLGYFFAPRVASYLSDASIAYPQGVVAALPDKVASYYMRSSFPGPRFLK